MATRKTKDDPTRGIFRRHGRTTWWINFRYEGKKVQLSLGTDNHDAAIVKAMKVRANPELYLVLPGKWELEVEEYLAAKIAGTAPGKRHRGDTTGHTRDSLAKFHAFAPIAAAAMACKHHIDGWLAAMKKDGMADTSITTHYARVTGFFRWAVAEARCRETPCITKLEPLQPHVVARDEVMTGAQVAKAFEINDRDDVEFVLLAGCDAGLRKEEIIMARPEWVDMIAATITIPRDDPASGFVCKNRKKHTVPLSDRFLAFLERTGWADREKGRKFILHPEANSRPYRWDPDAPIDKIFAAIGFSAGSMHSMRHTFASTALSIGKTIWEVSQMLGDTTKTVEQTYGHFIPKRGALQGMYVS